MGNLHLYWAVISFLIGCVLLVGHILCTADLLKLCASICLVKAMYGVM